MGFEEEVDPSHVTRWKKELHDGAAQGRVRKNRSTSA
jgi:hypothetical protein